jgi:hypothetical protein
MTRAQDALERPTYSATSDPRLTFRRKTPQRYLIERHR